MPSGRFLVCAAGLLAFGLLAWTLRLSRRATELRARVRRLTAKETTLRVRHRELLDAISDIVFVLSHDGRFMEMNRAAERAFGGSKDDLAGASILGRVAVHDRSKIERLLSLEEDSVAEGILELCVRDGQGFGRILELTSWLPAERGARGGFRAVARDITAHRAAEDAFVRLRSRIAELEPGPADFITTGRN